MYSEMSMPSMAAGMMVIAAHLCCAVIARGDRFAMRHRERLPGIANRNTHMEGTARHGIA